MNKPMIKPELLAPAGSLEKLKMAITYGADAVYLGGKQFGLRAGAGNFTPEEMAEGVEIAHSRGVKVYVTINIFAHNEDLRDLPDYLRSLAELKVDAVIISDPGVLEMAREYAPNLELHLSTQANTTNWASARFWEKQGVTRIVLARELSLEEIREVRDKTGVELEVFVHGAMCMSYSGRCLISNYLAHRDANRGECAQPCRWKYALVEENRPGQYFPIEEDERGSYIFNSHDLSMLEHLPELVKAGIASFKIEGRMKSVHYVSTVVKVYRQALDAYFADPDNYKVRADWKEEIAKVSHRDYTTGFYFGKPNTEAHTYGSSSYLRSYDFVGVIIDYDAEKGLYLVEQRNKIFLGDNLEAAGPKGEPQTFILEEMRDMGGNPVESAPHPQQKLYMKIPFEVDSWSMLRRFKEERQG